MTRRAYTPAATASIPHAGALCCRPWNSSPLTDRAAARIAEIVAEPRGAESALRVAVLAGGCSGFQYRFELDDATAGR